MGLPVFSAAIKNITTAYKHSGTLEGGAELWVASASAFLVNPSDAVSSDGPALHGAQPPEQRAPATVSRAQCHGHVTARFYPLCGAEERVQLKFQESIW